MDNSLGAIKKLDVRTVWSNETTEFTPWLANEENVSKLSREIGIELEIEDTEVAVGPYFADILARDTGTDQLVVIENQLEKINHDHLGKAITYAAVLDAKTIIWIAREFTEEHRKAIDWLNDNSTDDIAYYGVSLELWQIDDSRPAVQFNVVTRSSDIFKKSVVTGDKKVSETKMLQFEFWKCFAQKLSETKEITSVGKPAPRYWYNVPLGRTGIHLSNIANTFDNRIGIRVYIRHKRNGKAAFEQLLTQKTEIENEIGESLTWDPNPDAIDKTIVLNKEADIRNRDKWYEYCEWFVEMTLKFRKAFMNRIKRLDLSVQPEIEEERDEG